MVCGLPEPGEERQMTNCGCIRRETVKSEWSVVISLPIRSDMWMVLIQIVREVTVSSEGGTARCRRC